VAPSWILFFSYQDDAQSNTQQKSPHTVQHLMFLLQFVL